MTIPFSTASDEQRVFAARLASLSDAAAFAQDFCDRHGIAQRDALRLSLIIEELFTNTVRHGYRGDCDAPIRIALAIEDGTVLLRYEDAAPPHDPLARLVAATASLATPFESRPVGGLGEFLVGVLAEHARYAYEDGCNRLWLRLRRAP
jgi:serine/threonine-protein kinase RsbW